MSHDADANGDVDTTRMTSARSTVRGVRFNALVSVTEVPDVGPPSGASTPRASLRPHLPLLASDMLASRSAMVGAGTIHGGASPRPLPSDTSLLAGGSPRSRVLPPTAPMQTIPVTVAPPAAPQAVSSTATTTSTAATTITTTNPRRPFVPWAKQPPPPKQRGAFAPPPVRQWSHALTKAALVEPKRRAQRQQEDAYVQQIDAYLAAKRLTREGTRMVVDDVLDLRQHRDVAEEVRYTCLVVDRLLNRLEGETTVSEVPPSPDTLLQKRVEEREDGDYAVQVLGLRDNAAHEALHETASLDDYSAAPAFPNSAEAEAAAAHAPSRSVSRAGTPSPSHSASPVDAPLAGPAAGDHALESEHAVTPPQAGNKRPPLDLSKLPSDALLLRHTVRGVAASIKKAHYSHYVVTSLMHDNPTWFQSMHVCRRLKASLIRCNYHGRRAKLWSDAARSQVFIMSSTSNAQTEDAGREIVELKMRQAGQEARWRAAVKQDETHARLAAGLQEEIEAERAIGADLDARLKAAAHVSGSPLVAETLLLLQLLQAVPRLQSHVAELRQWLIVEDTVGDKISTGAMAQGSPKKGGGSTF